MRIGSRYSPEDSPEETGDRCGRTRNVSDVAVYELKFYCLCSRTGEGYCIEPFHNTRQAASTRPSGISCCQSSKTPGRGSPFFLPLSRLRCTRGTRITLQKTLNDNELAPGQPSVRYGERTRRALRTSMSFSVNAKHCLSCS